MTASGLDGELREGGNFIYKVSLHPKFVCCALLIGPCIICMILEVTVSGVAHACTLLLGRDARFLWFYLKRLGQVQTFQMITNDHHTPLEFLLIQLTSDRDDTFAVIIKHFLSELHTRLET